MTKEDIENLLESKEGSMSDEAYTVLENIMNEYDLNDEDDFQTALNEQLGNQFVYYSDAFDFLQKQCITDYSKAIAEYGAKTVTEFAYYYLEDEIYNII